MHIYEIRRLLLVRTIQESLHAFETVALTFRLNDLVPRSNYATRLLQAFLDGRKQY
jgi:hypothetical protein